jgi:hypothetical protein
MSSCCGTGFLGGRLPSNTPSGGDGFVRSIIWVDLRIGPGGDGTEATPFNTIAAGVSAVPDGGTLMVVGGDASAASPVALAARSLTIHGLSGQDDSGGRTVELPLLEHEITTGTQRLAFHHVSLTLAHTGADNSLTELYFRHCPLVSVLADGDAPPITWVGSPGCSFSGSGGAASFDGGTVAGYVANAGGVSFSGVNITGNVTSGGTVTIRNGSSFGAGVTITAPTISIDPVSYDAASAAGVIFSTGIAMAADFLGATTGYVLTRQPDGTWAGEAPSGGGGGFSLPPGGVAGEVLESDGAGGAVWAVDDTGGLGSISTDVLIGRDTPSTGAAEEIGVGGGLEFTGSKAIQRSALAGDVTASAGSGTTTIANDAVTFAKFQNMSGLSVLARASNTSGDAADLVAGTDGFVLQRSGTSLAWGLIVAASITNSTITLAKFQDIATDRVLGRDTAGTGVVEQLTVSGGLEFTGSGGIQSSAYTGDVTKTAGGTALTIANDAVTYAKMQNVSATSRFLGRITASAGDVEELTGTQATTLLDSFTSALKGLTPASGGGTANYLRADGTWTAPSFTVADNSITFAKIQDISTDVLIGRDTAATGDPEEIGVGGGIEFTGSKAIQRSALTGDVTATAGSNATTIATAAVTFAKFQNVAGLSVVGRASNTSGVAADITAANDGEVLRRSGTTIGFGTIATASITNSSVTFAKFQDISTDRLLGRDTAGTGAVEQLTVGGGIEFTGSAGIQVSAFTGDVTKAAGATTLTIPNDTVTYAKMQNISATSRFIGRITIGAGDPEELTGTQATTILDVFTSSLKGLASASGGGTANFLRADNTWAAPPNTTTPGGSTTQVQYNNAGAMDGASGITVVGSETGLKLTYVEGPGTPVGTNGFVRLAEPTTLVPIVSYVSYNGSANSLALSISGDGSTFTDVFVGDAGATGNFSAYLQAKGQAVFNLAGTNEYVFGTTTADFTNNAIVTTGVLYLGATSGPGRINIANNQWISWKHATSGDVLGISVLSDNAVRVGNTTNAAALYLQSAGGAGFEIASGGAVSMAFGATTEYSFSATAANFLNNALLFGSSAAASGYIRFPAGSADLLVVNQTSDRVVMSFSTTGPTLSLGGTTCDTTILSEHILRGKLVTGADVFLFEDDGDAAITALNVADASAHPFLIRAAGSTSGSNSGGQLRLAGGKANGGGNQGGAALLLNQDDSTYHTMVEVAQLAASRRAVSLCGSVNLSTVPAGAGDKVVFIGDSATAPTIGTAPSGGGILFSQGGVLKWLSPAGFITTLAA